MKSQYRQPTSECRAERSGVVDRRRTAAAVQAKKLQEKVEVLSRKLHHNSSYLQGEFLQNSIDPLPTQWK